MIPFLVYAEIYKWVDEKGTVHFTEDNSTIPEKYGRQVEEKVSTGRPKAYDGGEKNREQDGRNSSSSPEVQDTPLLFSGMISAVGAGMIFVTGEGKDMVFLVSEDTSIKTDYGQKASFSDLKNGRPVTIEYIKEGGDNHARSIKVSILLAGTPNVVEENKDDKENQNGPGKMQNPGETQKRVWESQKAHKKPKKSSK